ncbi:DUF4870 domain-containing protein [Microbacterium sp.]|uniref:DUF4870 domain-containing protein n=1 Tax=Microbacterium sp. TaxID=51671 RepID=UPI003A8B2BC2
MTDHPDVPPGPPTPPAPASPVPPPGVMAEGRAPDPGAPYAGAPYAGAPYPGAYASTPKTGAVAWGMGFLAFIPVPFVNFLVAAITVVIVGLGQRKYGGVAAGNGVQAANWALTFFPLVVVGAVLNLTAVINAAPGETGMSPPGVLGTLLLAGAGIANLVFLIVGLVKANRGEIFRAPGIPFFRVS